MKEKLLALMKSEGLKPSQLADILEINPAGISHIMAGRNKPGFDLLQKILKRFPQIDPDWLLLDSESMYRRNYKISSSTVSAASPLSVETGTEITDGLFSRSTGVSEHAACSEADSKTSSAQISSMPAALHPASGKRGATVERIVIFYSDQTFEYFMPSENERI